MPWDRPLPAAPRSAAGTITAGHRPLILALLAGLALTVVFHRFSVLSGFDLVQADPGDSRFVIFTLEHDARALAGLAPWRSPPLFYPVPGTLGYSDILLGMAVPYGLFRLLGAGPFTAAALMQTLLSFLSYAAALGLLRGALRLRWLPAAVGAGFFAFCYPKFAQLVHLQLRFDLLQPVALALLLAPLIDGRPRSGPALLARGLALTASLMLLAATAFYPAWLLGLLLLITGPLLLVLAPLRRAAVRATDGHWAWLLAGLAAGAVPAAVLVAVYGPVLAETGGRSWPAVLAGIPEPGDLIWLGSDNGVWGWLTGHWPERALANWPERRIGVGIVATLAWIALVPAALAVLRSGAITAGAGRKGDDGGAPRRTDLAVAALVLGSVVLAVLAVRIGDQSLWRLVYHGVPGAGGIRAVSRVFLVTVLPLAAGLAWALDRLGRRPRLKPLAALLIAVLAAEQLAMPRLYSAATVGRFQDGIAALIDPACPAFLLMAAGPPQLGPPLLPSPLTEQNFDAAAYLAANPDVARSWTGSAWAHYQQFGRLERRSLSPAMSNALAVLYAHYQYTAIMAAVTTGIPTLNGISGWAPPDWDLADVYDPGLPARARAWLVRHGRPDTLCIIRHDLTLSDMPEPPRSFSGF